MNNASGSALQKVTFFLTLCIAAALGYWLVHERTRHRQEAEETAATAASQSAPGPASGSEALPPAAAVPKRTEYAPLRDRAVTNVVRVLTNRPILSTVSERFVVVEKPAIAGTLPVPAAPDPAVQFTPGGFDRGTAGSGNTAITGQVLLSGTPPPEKAITLDPTCGRLHTAPITTRLYVVGEGGGLADVLVYIKTGAPKTPPPAGVTPLLDQINCEYQPYVMALQAGQTLKVRNSDPLLHNVHVLPKSPGNRERNAGQPVKGMTTSFAFVAPEVFIQFKCDVHPWMFAYVGVVDHPWFAVTDAKGNFALPAGLPPGQYTLSAVHRKAGEVLQTITVTDQGVAPITLTLTVPQGLATAGQ